MIQPALIVDDIDDQIRSFLIFALISFMSHLIIFALIAFVHLPTSFERRVELPPTIDVDLLAFNPETPLPPAKVKTAVASPLSPIAPMDQLIDKISKMPAPSSSETLPVKKGLKKKKNPSDYVVAKPKKDKKTKKPLKKKKIDTEQVLQKAVKRIENQTEASHPKSVSDRIESLKKEVRNQSGKPSKAAPASTSVSSGKSYSKDFSQIEIFQAEVSVRMKNNWVFSDKLAGQTKGLESRLVIKILPGGEITDVWFEKRSGNEYLDNSAYKTVMKSNPLPPLPAGFAYYHLVLGFTPSGLN
jgi:colicin import membrane protein